MPAINHKLLILPALVIALISLLLQNRLAGYFPVSVRACAKIVGSLAGWWLAMYGLVFGFVVRKIWFRIRWLPGYRMEHEGLAACFYGVMWAVAGFAVIAYFDLSPLITAMMQKFYSLFNGGKGGYSESLLQI